MLGKINLQFLMQFRHQGQNQKIFCLFHSTDWVEIQSFWLKPAKTRFLLIPFLMTSSALDERFKFKKGKRISNLKLIVDPNKRKEFIVVWYNNEE